MIKDDSDKLKTLVVICFGTFFAGGIVAILNLSSFGIPPSIWVFRGLAGFAMIVLAFLPTEISWMQNQAVRVFLIVGGLLAIVASCLHIAKCAIR